MNGDDREEVKKNDLIPLPYYNKYILAKVLVTLAA